MIYYYAKIGDRITINLKFIIFSRLAKWLSESALPLNSKSSAAPLPNSILATKPLNKIMTSLCPNCIYNNYTRKNSNIPEFFQRIPVDKNIAVKAASNGAKWEKNPIAEICSFAIIRNIARKALLTNPQCVNPRDIYRPLFANFGFLHIRMLKGVTSTSSSSWMYSMQSSRL